MKKVLLLLVLVSLFSFSGVSAHIDLTYGSDNIPYSEKQTTSIIKKAITHQYDFHLSKKEYLALAVGNYVNGFKEFDTGSLILSDLVIVGIYYDAIQDEKKAHQLKEKFVYQIPKLINKYDWGKNYTVTVNAFLE